jgi:cytoskeletal protein CcmA (bactofilin family)
MTWLGQKPEPEPIRPVAPATAVSPQVAPTPIPVERVEKRMETPRVASIGKSLHVKGELSGNEDVAIEGKVEGKISLTGYNVTIGETGRVAAELHAKSVVIAGLVHGNVVAGDRVEVAATGTMMGDIRSPRVVLVDGCRFKGSIDMESKSGTGASVAAPATGKATSEPSRVREETPAYAGATKS